MKISVLIPTYRRPQDLQRCLNALRNQIRLADEVIVVVRNSDYETHSVLGTFPSNVLPLRTVVVDVPGVVAAMNAGLLAAHGDVLALIDDDTAPRTDWLERIEEHFTADERLGALGGRDWQELNPGNEIVVGIVQWHGRVIGNHHLGTGPAREVDVVKGANCAFRTQPLRIIGFDTRLLGNGAQVHWEISLCLALKRAGWKLIYDPAVALDHYPSQRFDEDQRNNFNAIAVRNMVYNETLILLEHLPWYRRVVYFLYALVVGLRIAPGLFQLPRLVVRRERNILPRFIATFKGRMEALGYFLRSQKALSN